MSCFSSAANHKHHFHPQGLRLMIPEAKMTQFIGLNMIHHRGLEKTMYLCFIIDDYFILDNVLLMTITALH